MSVGYTLENLLFGERESLGLTYDRFVDKYGYSILDDDEFPEIMWNDAGIDELLAQNRIVSYIEEEDCDCDFDEDSDGFMDEHDEKTCTYINGEGGNVELGWWRVNVLKRAVLPEKWWEATE